MTADPIATSSDGRERGPLRIAFFAHDAMESTVIKRAVSFEREGAEVLGLMFQRRRTGLSRRSGWRNIDLGFTVDRNYIKRIMAIIRGIAIVIKNRKELKQCDVIYARNLDMLAIAVFCCITLRLRPVFGYEILDVQRILTGTGLINRTLRAAEGYLLARCAVVVISSPDFQTKYLRPVQGFAGRCFLLENKVSPHQLDLGSLGQWDGAAAPPWVIGWFGTLRCQKSLAALCSIADALGEKVSVILRGRPSAEDLTVEEIESVTKDRPNMRYMGAYESPRDLQRIYSEAHFSWAIDYLDEGTNSDWLLPNRIYEGGLFGSLALARTKCATGELVTEKRLGWAFDEPIGQSITDFLRNLQETDYGNREQQLAALSRDMFVDFADTSDLLGLLRGLCQEKAGERAQLSERS